MLILHFRQQPHTFGIHYWNVTCWDGRDNENIINLNTSETRTFNVFIPPNITLDTPKENNWTSNTNQIFYFNISDETGIENCSIRLDGIINDTKIGDELTNNGKNNFTINNLAGSYNWSVECYDNSSFNTYNITENRTIHVDIYEPEPSIETSNGTWFNSANPSIDFNITDNMDLHINYTFYVNGTLNVEGNADNGSSISTNLQNLNNGSYIVELEALDNAGNRKNSTNITIFIDTVKPSMQLYFPEDGNVTSDGDVYFNWTANDNLAPIIECNLTIDGDVNITVNVTNGVAWNETVNGLNAGLHHWNVTCIDLAGNFNTSETRNFTVPMPDLYIESDYITFNKTSPEENETITINATIKNIGNTDAGSFKVQFWNGDPDNGGEQINGNLTIASLATGANTSVNVSFNAEIGLNTIFVLVDVPLATNGAISEDDETNNEANNTFIVEQFHIIAGTTNDELRITDASYVKLFTWSGINLTDSNVYVADTDNNIEWGSLQAVGRNTTNETTTNDFEEIDIAFGSTSFTDSINKTYTNAGSPKLTQNFTVFSKNIGYVPVVNSTNTSDFVTGLLWDYSDGNVEFNATQDLLLITRINQNKTGKYGTYDYEIKVPAPLRSYKGATNMVTFYTEII